MATRAASARTVLLAAISGPLLATLILLPPFGLLTLVLAFFDPKLAVYRAAPVWVTLSPWVALAALISAGNVRLARLLAADEGAGRIFRIATDRYAGDPSAKENVNGFPGRRIVEDFIAFVSERETGADIGAPIAEDYGWGFWIGSPGFAPVWTAFSFAGPVDEGGTSEEYVASVNLEPPFLPWKRLAFEPDIALRDRLEAHLADFLAANVIPFTTEIEG